jgi:glycogen(starch) synthase
MNTGSRYVTPHLTISGGLRILHVLDHSWPIHTGYSLRSLNLIAAQAHLGMQPMALTGPLQCMDDPNAQDLVVDGIKYIRSSRGGNLSTTFITKRVPFLRETEVVRLIRSSILKILATDSVDIIHAHSPALCGLGALLAARTKKLPFVYELRAFWEDAAVDQNKTRSTSFKYALSQALENYVVHRADAVVGIASSILEELNARGADPKKLFHVPNGVDVAKFAPTPKDSDLAVSLGLGPEPVLGFIGSLYRWEGVAWLVTAVKELQRQGTKCNLLIVGDGEEMSAVRSAVAAFGNDTSIQVLGRVNHSDIARYYSVIDVLAYPRHRVRLTDLVTPLKPLEAMALGKAVLGSDVGGIRELVESEKTGLLFKADDVADFCRKAKRLLEDPSLRNSLGHNARQATVAKKDWNVLAGRYLSVYEAAIQNHG